MKTEEIRATKRSHEMGVHLQLASQRPMAAAGLSDYVALLIYKWGGLLGATIWFLWVTWMAWFFGAKLWGNRFLSFLWTPGGVFLIVLVLLSVSVLCFSLGLRLGRQFVRCHIQGILGRQAFLQGNLSERVRMLASSAWKQLWINPLVLIPLTFLMLIRLLMVAKNPTPEGSPVAWELSMTLTFILVSQPVLHLLTGYLFGWFHHLNWTSALKHQLASQSIVAPRLVGK